jgi:dihydroxy-acid dehydratase
MACLLEALGMAPLGSATPPAPSSARLRVAEQTGSILAQMLQSTSSKEPRKPQDILTRKSIENAITMLHAIGGSTNAVVHLLAIAGRVPGLGPSVPQEGGVTLSDFEEIGKRTPLLVDLKPSGDAYMEDFHRAGGVPVVLNELVKGNLIHLDAPTIEASTLGEALAAYNAKHRVFHQEIVRPLANPIYPKASLVVLRGNLSPAGCIIKASAATPSLLKHRGPAIVFNSTDDLAARIDAPDLHATPDSVLVLRNAGPVGHPGMPEAGLLPIPRVLASQGVQDMVRISDARMSGTAQGTVVLHVAPEAAVGGPIALVRDGDMIEIDVDKGIISVKMDGADVEEELERRKDEWLKAKTGLSQKKRGYAGMYERSVEQANFGADFSWLKSDQTKDEN